MTTAAPAQHTQALARANEVRSYRAAIKRDLSHGDLLLRDLDLDDPELRTMPVSEILRALPWKSSPRTRRSVYTASGARATYRRLLRSMDLSDTITFGALTCARKDEFKLLVSEKCPSQREP